MTINHRGANIKSSYSYARPLWGKIALENTLSRLVNSLERWQLYKGHLDY